MLDSEPPHIIMHTFWYQHNVLYSPLYIRSNLKPILNLSARVILKKIAVWYAIVSHAGSLFLQIEVTVGIGLMMCVLNVQVKLWFDRCDVLLCLTSSVN